MAMTLRKRVPRPQESSDSSPIRKRPKPVGRRPRVRRPATRRRGRGSSRDSEVEDDDDDSSSEEDEEVEEVEEEEDEIPEYEKIREQRMRENKEKMEKLGIFSLSKKFKPQVLPRRRGAHRRKPSVTRSFAAPYERARRSSRLKEVGRITYFKDEGTLESMGISVPEGWAPEAYTEEHEKLLGNCEKPWALYVDGYGEDGERLYDPLNGKMCHQCRQKTVGNISICRKCKSAKGQLCGDCLYMRYRENVLEANENLNWSCPSCRDICNCSRCRRAKGWDPTTCVYQKVIEQGHKSIAHYLIQTRSAKNKPKQTTVGVDPNADPQLNSQFAPQVIYSDSSDGSSDVEPDGYNSDSSEEEAEKNNEASIAVLDDEASIAVVDDEASIAVLDDEALLVTDNEDKVVAAELKEEDEEQEIGVVCA